MAFFGSYIFHLGMIYAVAHWLTGFRWTSDNVVAAGFLVGTVLLLFVGFFVLRASAAYSLGAMLLLINTVYGVRRLALLLDDGEMPSPVRKILVGLRLIDTKLAEQKRRHFPKV